MIIAFGADHAGFEMKEFLRNNLEGVGIETADMGTYSQEPVDYPDLAQKVGEFISLNDADFGILVCGTGIGMCISANKVKGIRAALCLTPEFAELARRHNNANILCLPGRFMETGQALDIAKKFISTGFDGDLPDGARHRKRVEKIAVIEGENY